MHACAGPELPCRRPSPFLSSCPETGRGSFSLGTVQVQGFGHGFQFGPYAPVAAVVWGARHRNDDDGWQRRAAVLRSARQ